MLALLIQFLPRDLPASTGWELSQTPLASFRHPRSWVHSVSGAFLSTLLLLCFLAY